MTFETDETTRYGICVTGKKGLLMNSRNIIVVAASRGALPVLRSLVAELPSDLDATICLVMHIGRHPSTLPELLSRWGPLPASHPLDGEAVQRGRIYVAPPDRHMILRDGKISLLDTAPENFARPAADPLFRSAAFAYKNCVVGVVLSGDLDDGAAGLAAIHARGGYGLAQDPDKCEAPSMPRSAIATGAIDAIAAPESLAKFLLAAVSGASATEDTLMTNRPDLDREAQIGEKGLADPSELDEIGERSALTCPSCNGTLWRVRDERPLRYRCHTGHAFSALSLDEASAQKADDAIWGAIRAVHERIFFAIERKQWAQRSGSNTAVALEQARIDENEKLAELLRAAAGGPER